MSEGAPSPASVAVVAVVAVVVVAAVVAVGVVAAVVGVVATDVGDAVVVEVSPLILSVTNSSSAETPSTTSPPKYNDGR